MKSDPNLAIVVILRRVALGTLSLVFLVLLLSAGYATYSWSIGNFHVVDPGQIYRSAQPTPEQLEAWHRGYGITTVLNLRGANPGHDWYDAEHQAVADLGMRLIDYPLSASHQLTAQQLEEILQILRSLNGPALIHCMSGVDRTGLVSAIYLADVAKAGETAAKLQLSLLYGHIPLSLSPFYAMDRSFEAAEPLLGYPDS